MKCLPLILMLLIAGCTHRSSNDLRGRELYRSYQYEGSNGWEATQLATIHHEENFLVSAKMFDNGEFSFSGNFDRYQAFGPPSDRREMLIDSIVQGFISESCEIAVREDDGEWSRPDSVTAIDLIPTFDTLAYKRLGYERVTAIATRFEDLPPRLRRGGVSHWFHFRPFTGHNIRFQVHYKFRRQDGTTDSISKQLHYQRRLTRIEGDL